MIPGGGLGAGRAPGRDQGGFRLSGFSILELLVAMLLLGLVVQGGWAVLATFRRAAEGALTASETLETVRTVGWILEQELSGGSSLPGQPTEEGDSLALRAFRGLALILDGEGPGGLTVCYRGVREPNPEKDSLLVLVEGGHWISMDLLGRTAGGEGCWDGSGGRKEEWRVEGGAWNGAGYLARVFERGAYYFSQSAFRYRTGNGGRQPLTVQNLQEGTFDFLESGTWGVEWRLKLPTPGLEAGEWRGRIQ